MSTGSARPQPTATDDLKVIGKTAWGLLRRSFQTVKQKLDPNTQVTGILLDRYYAMRDKHGMSHDAALEATVAAAKADLVKAVADMEAAARDAGERGEGAEGPGGGSGS